MGKKFGPALMRAGSDGRRRWLTWVVAVVLIGALGGALFAAAAAARRTGSAYDRLRAASAAPDLIASPSPCGDNEAADVCGSDVDDRLQRTDARLGALAAQPGVLGVSLFNVYSGVFALESGRSLQEECNTGSGEVSLLAPVDASLGVPVQRPVVLEGRAADPSRLDEVVIGVAMRDDGVHVGDTIAAELGEFCPEEGSPPRSPIELRVVGVAADTVGLRPEFGSFLRTLYGTEALEAWARQHDVSRFPAAFVRLDATTEPASVLPDDGSLEAAFTGAELRSSMERSIGPDLLVLLLLAGIGVAFTLFVVAPAIARVEHGLLLDAPVLRTIGFTRGDLARVGVLHGVAVAVPAAVLAVLIAVAASTLTPLGDAAAFEPSPGVSADWVVLGLGTLLLVVLTVALTTYTATLQARTPVDATRLTGSRIADHLQISPVGRLGVRFAFDAMAGRVASGTGRVLTQVIGIAAVVGALTFTAGLDQLRAQPRLVGWNWDAAVVGAERPDDLAAELRATAGIERVSVGTFFSPLLTLGPDELQSRLMSLEAGPASVPFTVIEGRSPTGDREILVHPKVLDQLALDVGDTTTARLPQFDGASAELTIVGTGVLPMDAQQYESAAAMTYAGLADLLPAADREELTPDIVVFDADDEVDLTALGERLVASGLVAAPGLVTGDGQLGVGLVAGLSVGGVDQVPRVLAAMAALLAAGVLAHLLVARRREWQRELALHRAIGFTHLAVHRAVALGAALVALVAAVIGIPLGVAAGRVAWLAYVDSIGVKPEAVVPWSWLAVVAAGAVVVAVLAATVAGAVTDRKGLAQVLRTE